ncbi:hypothetical protein QYF61_005971 [Mycteria americana]|uniref:Uncharacterized protein n=1 Tax=Mycteria americana TaxID=33587 RepID=A0AAN7NLN1_MYCAM|nr:hypothetical protein QYF61_005971 [Mycteria americana]
MPVSPGTSHCTSAGLQHHQPWDDHITLSIHLHQHQSIGNSQELLKRALQTWGKAALPIPHACLEKRGLRGHLLVAFQCLKGASKKDGDRLFNRACSDRVGVTRAIFNQSRLLRAPANLTLDVSRDGAATISPGNLGQRLTTLSVKHFFLSARMTTHRQGTCIAYDPTLFRNVPLFNAESNCSSPPLLFVRAHSSEDWRAVVLGTCKLTIKREDLEPCSVRNCASPQGLSSRKEAQIPLLTWSSLKDSIQGQADIHVPSQVVPALLGNLYGAIPRSSVLLAFHYLKGAYKKDGDRLLSRACYDRTRGNSLKLKQGGFRLDLRKKFFMRRVVRHWHRCPERL